MTAGPATEPVVQVPVDLDLDERLAGPVTFRMAGWLAAAGAGTAAVVFSRGSLLLTVVGVVIGMVGLTGAFVRPGGRPAAAWLVPLLGYRRRQRVVRRARRD